MSLKNMAQTKEETAEYGSSMLGATAQENEAPMYPYGLTINLDDSSIDKLGLPPGLPVGTKVMILAVAEVCGANSYKSQEGEAENSYSLQITDMDVKPAADDVGNQSAGDKLYPGA